MDRLQKKCFIASAGFHLLLASILLVGPAFLSSSPKSDSTPILDVIPAKVIDAAMNGGGNPNAKPPPPMPETKPQPPAPQPQPEVRPPPEPVRETLRETKPEKLDKVDADSLEASTEKTKKLPKISLTPITRKTTSRKTTSEAVADAQQQRAAEQRRRAAAAIGSLAQNLRDDMSGAVSIDSNVGPGGGGEAYASYDQVVRSIYYHAWVAPDDTASDDAIVKAEVTIARDGNVLSHRILRASGDAGVDRSIQRTLERVTFVHAFPEGAKEKERTYTINFNLKAKRLSG